jgi:hypothetical protein
MEIPMRSIFYDAEMEPYYRAGQRLLEQQTRHLNTPKYELSEKERRRTMGLLFKHGPEDYRRQRQTLKIEPADRGVVTIFTALQAVWRRQGTLRRTYDGMPTSREERAGWKHLIEYLARDLDARP